MEDINKVIEESGNVMHKSPRWAYQDKLYMCVNHITTLNALNPHGFLLIARIIRVGDFIIYLCHIHVIALGTSLVLIRLWWTIISSSFGIFMWMKCVNTCVLWS